MTPPEAGVFRVLVNTEGVRLEQDGKPASLHGFSANVYVFSWSERTAGAQAMRKLLKRVHAKSGSMRTVTLVQMHVEGVERCWIWEAWKLWIPEGLTFYPMKETPALKV